MGSTGKAERGELTWQHARDVRPVLATVLVHELDQLRILVGAPRTLPRGRKRA